MACGLNSLTFTTQKSELLEILECYEFESVNWLKVKVASIFHQKCFIHVTYTIAEVELVKTVLQ